MVAKTNRLLQSEWGALTQEILFPAATTGLEDAKATYRYAPAKAFDGDPATAWVEGVKGPGFGQKIAFTLKDETANRMRSMEILPGLGVEKYFTRNNRMKMLRISGYCLNDGGPSAPVDRSRSSSDTTWFSPFWRPPAALPTSL